MGERGCAWIAVALWLLVGERRTLLVGAQDGGLLEADYYPGVGLDYPADADYPELEAHYPHGLDYLDADGQYLPFVPSVSNSTLRKCSCLGDQVLEEGGSCHNSTTSVLVLDVHTREHAAVYTAAFGSVQVGPLNCSVGQQRVVMHFGEKSKDFFAFLESGALYWDERVFREYCFDHTYDGQGNPTSMEIHLCLRQVGVPRCCPEGQALDANRDCTPAQVHAFAPPLKVGQEVVRWEDPGDGGIVDPSCEDESQTFHPYVNNGNVSLVYSSEGVLLEWLPPSLFPMTEKKKEFCVGLEASSLVQEEEPRYRAKFCYKDPALAHREACTNSTCVRKCCPEGLFFTNMCTPVELDTDVWEPVFHDPDNLEEVVSAPDNLTVVYGYPICTSFFQLESHRSEKDSYFLFPDGSLYVPSFSRKFPPDRYCLEKFLAEEFETHTLPLVCFREDGSSASTACTAVQSFVYPVLLAVSCVFLAITLLIYVSVPELHAKVHGKCLVSHMSALLLAYVSLITVQWASGLMPLAACKIMASVTHFSFLAAFFWLNVMCFDIWWTLKSMRPVAETGELSRFRFKMYSVYSWGCPVVISLVAIIVQALPEQHDIIRPDFGSKKCWFDNNKSLWAYFYGFVLVLVIANIIFFCQVAYILIMAQNDPIIQRTRQQNRERMWLYVKLFLVMGLTWIAEVISWQEGTCEAWIFTDIINALQGFSIFLIFICKKNMLRRIRSTWEPYLRRVKEFFGSSRQTKSATGKAGRETSSFSSSVNRPSQSSASQRTVQSQISFDRSSASRKMSTSSLVSTTGVQIHNPNTFSMDTINEATSPECEQGQDGSGPSIGSTTVEYPKYQRESTVNSNRRFGTQETTMNFLNTVKEETDDIKPANESLTDPEKVASLTNSFKHAPESPDDPIGDLEESVVPVNIENRLALEDTEEVTTQAEAKNPTLEEDALDSAPVKVTENGVMRNHEGAEQYALGNGSVLVQHKRAFTTEEFDDQPVDV